MSQDTLQHCTPSIVHTTYTAVDSVDLERCQLGQVQIPRLAEIKACKRRALYAVRVFDTVVILTKVTSLRMGCIFCLGYCRLALS